MHISQNLENSKHIWWPQTGMSVPRQPLFSTNLRASYTVAKPATHLVLAFDKQFIQRRYSKESYTENLIYVLKIYNASVHTQSQYSVPFEVTWVRHLNTVEWILPFFKLSFSLFYKYGGLLPVRKAWKQTFAL